MNNSHDDRLTPEEKERFDALPREMTPPASLESRVTGELRRRGLLGGRRSRWGWPGLVWTLAPSLAALVLGVFLGTSWGPRVPRPGPQLPRYLLILRIGAGFQEEASGARRRTEYADWAMHQLPEGAFLSGEELAEDGWNLRRAGKEIRADAMDDGQEPEGAVAGFFLIQAESTERAVELARTTPHLKYGGVVEVRPIEEGR